ncbi:MAG: elongation factor G [Thermodesulfobacteriota bacterium]
MEKKRNIAVIAHGGAGKTSLSEAMLHCSGATKSPGSVDKGTSHFDYEPEEQKRNISISSALHHYTWNGHRVNIIDTPGFSNFLGETRGSLRVVGGAVVIVSAISGVKVATERLWKYADEHEISRIAFVNKMDRDRANFFRAIDDMEHVLGVRGVAMQLPIGTDSEFKGVVDLLTKKAYYYKDDGTGAFDTKDIPEELGGEAERLRQTMVECIVESDDTLLEKYLEGESIEVPELTAALREGTLTRKFVPVFAGSASKNFGVNLLLDAINTCLPSPVDKGAIKGHAKGVDPETGEVLLREPDASAPFSALVFKTHMDPYTGKLSMLRIYSGSIEAGSQVINVGTGTKEKISHIYVLEGKDIKEVPAATAGDIVALTKLKDTSTGDTLSSLDAPIVFDGEPRPSPVLSYAIEGKSKGDEDKLSAALAKLMEEDLALEFKRDKQTKEFVIAGAGQMHLEASIEKLQRKYHCEVELKAPRTPYKETIRGSAKVQGKYKKQSGGHGQYGDTWLELRPLGRGEGFHFINSIKGGVIPRQFIPAVEKGVREAMESGVLAGFPVVDLEVELVDGSFHSVDSSEMAFKIAAAMGFRDAMAKCKPVILEPLMNMKIVVPSDNLGDVIGDINSRRGKILGAEPTAGSQTIRALVPMAEVVTYAPELRGMTGDRGMFTMEFSHYEKVPSYLSQKVITAATEGKKD